MSDRARQRSPLALVVLACLAEAPMHAYRMHELIKQRGKDTVVNVSQRNSVYQTITRLLRAGLIRVQETAKDEGRPERVTYQITDDGVVTLQGWMRDMLAAPTAEFPDLPAALAFLPVLSPKEVQRQLEVRLSTQQEQLANMHAVGEAQLKAGLPRLFLIEDDYRQAMLAAEIRWLEAVIDDLRSKRLTWSAAWLKQISAQLQSATG
jgi:DNA-binding PadR family transcriptional regulator